MDDISALEQRVAAALDRIERGLERAMMPPGPASPPPMLTSAPVSPAAAPGLAELEEALVEERLANAQLNERIRVIKDKHDAAITALESRLAAQAAQLDAQGLDLARLKKSGIALRETLRALREAAAAGAGDAHLINKSMLAELDALRAQRSAETAEMDEILAAMRPLLAEAAHA